jgi:hypothetical protein
MKQLFCEGYDPNILLQRERTIMARSPMLYLPLFLSRV